MLIYMLLTEKGKAVTQVSDQINALIDQSKTKPMREDRIGMNGHIEVSILGYEIRFSLS